MSRQLVRLKFDAENRLPDGFFVAQDNSKPPQFWLWAGDRDESAEPVCRLPIDLMERDLALVEYFIQAIRGEGPLAARLTFTRGDEGG